MLNKVVIGVDFAAGWEAIRPALPLLGPRLGIRRVCLVHVLEAGYTAAPEVGHADYYRQRLEAIAEELRGTGLEVEGRVETGRPAVVLGEVAAEVGANGLMLGSRGHSAWRELFLGSTVLDAARTATLPLAIVPVDAAIRSEGPMLLATDGSPASAAAESAFRQLVGEGAAGLAVHVESAAEPGVEVASARAEEARRAAERLAELEGDAISVRHLGGDPRTAIAELARTEEASLIVVGKRGHNPLRDLLLGSTAEAVCRNAATPVLLVPGTEPSNTEQ